MRSTIKREGGRKREYSETYEVYNLIDNTVETVQRQRPEIHSLVDDEKEAKKTDNAVPALTVLPAAPIAHHVTLSPRGLFSSTGHPFRSCGRTCVNCQCGLCGTKACAHPQHRAIDSAINGIVPVNEFAKMRMVDAMNGSKSVDVITQFLKHHLEICDGFCSLCTISRATLEVESAKKNLHSFRVMVLDDNKSKIVSNDRAEVTRKVRKRLETRGISPEMNTYLAKAVEVAIYESSVSREQYTTEFGTSFKFAIDKVKNLLD